MMRHWKKLLIGVGLFALFAFQNCSPVSIEMASKAPEVTAASINLTAQGCVNAVKLNSEKTKFIFVVDLSRSNMGEFYKANYIVNATTYSNYNFFDANLGTDIMGARFDTISDFVNTCGNSANSDYAIIGFSGAAGEVITNGVNNAFECKSRFLDSAGINGQLAKMKQVQQTEAAYYGQFKQPSTPFLAKNETDIVPFIFKETNYVAATDCINSTIQNDLIIPGNTTSNYQVFFISDGEAKAKSTGCEAATVTNKIQCYIDLMDVKLSYLMKLSAAKSKPIRIHSLYYTRSGAQNLSIESYMNYLSSIGQTSAPINLGSFQTTTGGNAENPFCKLLAVDKSIIYRTNKIFAVNTTVIKIGNKIKLDSDADGIPDDDEASFGGNPKNAHSLVPGVLDGVCKMIGSKALCQQARDQISCNPNLVNKFGLTDCDVKILHLEESAVRPELAGIDTDNDGIPDYIEIIKGLSPINSDSYLDFDLDGRTNLQEISMGLDPFTPDKESESVVLSHSHFEDQINQCTSGGWNLQIDSLGGLDGSNNLMFYFRTESKNTQGVFEYRVFNDNYNYKKIDSAHVQVQLNKDFVDVTDFELVTKQVSP